MRSALLLAISLTAAFSAIVTERRDAFGQDDDLSDQVDGLVHDGQSVVIDAIAAHTTGAPFDDSTLPGLTLPNPDDVPAVTERFIRCGELSALLFERRQFFGPENEQVKKLDAIVHAEQEACFALLTAQPASA
jgi:hypothetical protein